MLSVIVPAYNEPFIQNTIDSLLNNAQGVIEVICVLDNYTPKKKIKSDPRLKIIHLKKQHGMRGAINVGIAKSKGKFIMKCDSHCMFCPGYDTIMTNACKANWLMIPRRYALDETTWQRRRRKPGIDYHFLTFPFANSYGVCLSNQAWYWKKNERGGEKYNIDDTMTFQGSCWLANKQYFMKHVGYLDDRKETYGTFVDEPQEIGLKYWLGGGANKVIKTAWYAHLSKRPHHYDLGLFSREYKVNPDAVRGRTWSAKHWLNNEEKGMIHPFSWLVEKFWPVPGWPEDRKLWVFPEKSATIVNKEKMTYKPTKLCKLALKYNSDKCPQIGHAYTPFYNDFFKGKSKTKIKKVLQMGAGNIEGDLLMWRDFFPKAKIYGAGSFTEGNYDDKRITTYNFDETNKEDIERIVSLTGKDIDLVIDHGSHHIDHQMFLFQTLMPLLNKKAIYVVEDCWRPRQMRNTFPQYDCLIPSLRLNTNPVHDGLAVLTYKHGRT